jgi:alkylglycerol monooxygenase
VTQGLNYVAFAIPVFLGSIILEAIIARRRGRQGYYYFGTALSDIGTGTVFQALEVFLKLATLGIYAWVYQNARLIDWGEHMWVAWLLGLIGVDFLFYWWHRSSHVVNTLWAVHGVHHQSEDFNLAVALRQPAFEPITWFLFYVPLALLGVSPEIYIASYAIDRLYQFFIHTELVDKLPRPIEWLFNTPSHHRVHHGVQDQYLDKNYGAILIVWDRMFGTFEVEGERVVYGTTVPLGSYNPVWGNLSLFARIGWLAARAKTLREKLWAPFAHPAWLPAGVEPDPDEPKRMKLPKYRPAISRALAWYLAGHYLFIGVALIPFLLFEHDFTFAQLLAGSTLIILSNMAFLGLIEHKRWALQLERARGVLTAATIAWLASAWFGAAWLAVIVVVVLAVMIGSLLLFREALESVPTAT